MRTVKPPRVFQHNSFRLWIAGLRCFRLIALAIGLHSAHARQSIITSDDFPSPEVVESAAFSFTGTLANATSQSGEPAHGGIPASRSRWIRLRAPNHGWYSLELSIYSIESGIRVAVYTNDTLSELQPVAAKTVSQENPAIQWEAVAGQEFHVAVDSTNIVNIAFSGRFDQFILRGIPERLVEPNEVLELEAVFRGSTPLVPPVRFFETLRSASTGGRVIASLAQPPWIIRYTNTVGGAWRIRAEDLWDRASSRPPIQMKTPGDMLASPVELPASFSEYRSRLSLTFAGVEPGEPLPQGGAWQGSGRPASIWWRWTPSFSGPVELAGYYQSQWVVYSGDPLLTPPLVNGSTALSFNAVAGTTYHFQLIGLKSAVELTEIRFTRDALRLLLPDDARWLDNRRWALASAVTRVAAAVPNPDHDLGGIRLNDQAPTGIDSLGRPFFDLSISNGFQSFEISATNRAGDRITSPQILLGHHENDDVTRPGRFPDSPSAQECSAILTSFSPGELAIPGNNGQGTLWWEFQSDLDTTADVTFSLDTEAPFFAAVFDAEGETNRPPIAIAGRNARFPGNVMTLRFPVKNGRRYLVGTASASDYRVSPLHLSRIRWSNLPRATDPETVLRLRLEDLRPQSGAFRVLGISAVDQRTRNYELVDPRLNVLGEFTHRWNSFGSYLLAVEYEVSGSPFPERWTYEAELIVGPRNDRFNFAKRARFSDGRLLMTGYNQGSGVEAGEPVPFGPVENTVWHRWVATGDADITVSAAQGRPRQYAVFRGESLTNLALIATNTPENAPIRFHVDAGAPYYFAVHSTEQWNSRQNAYQLELSGTPPPAPKIDRHYFIPGPALIVEYSGFGEAANYPITFRGAAALNGEWTFRLGTTTAEPPDNRVTIGLQPDETSVFLKLETY